MGRALEVLTGFTTAASTTLTALTMASQNSLTIRNTPNEAGIWLLNAWTDNQVAGNLRIRSPKLHDNTQGIRLATVASEVEPLLPMGQPQKLFPQDTLTVELSGSGTAGDIETVGLLVYYEDLPGVMGRFIDEAELKSRMRHVHGIENTLTLGTAGGYSGSEAINAEQDVLKANTDYALMGYLTTVECAVLGWQGTDSGNLRVGGPGNELRKQLTANWFVNLSKHFSMPLIPVFNSANRANILIDGAQDENGSDPLVISIFAELAM